MKKKKPIFIILSVIAALGAVLFIRTVFLNRASTDGKTGQSQKSVYYCPMHPNFTSDKPGSCAICGMTLVKNEPAPHEGHKTGGKKIAYYRNPMNPEVISPVPMKDSMGMEYVPVYSEEEGGRESGITISPERQQLIGVKKEMVIKRLLSRQIMTVGKVAYDPDLYVAQEEYLQALKTAEATKKSVLVSVATQSNSLVEASQKKLMLLGMSKEQIEELAKSGSAQENLYLPVFADTVWVYVTIYEYEIGLVKAGQEVTIDATAYPGETFQGKVIALTPVLNVETRSLRARVEVKDPEHKLKPEMFVNAKIIVDLGEKLAVPETAVLDTGVRKIVYLVKDADRMESREVVLGQKAQGYYEVVSGLNEGDNVVTSGNFLVDSESKLKGALEGGSEHTHGQ